MRPDYYISRVTLEKLIAACEVGVKKLAMLRKRSADHANDILQALKELHEHNYGEK